MNLKTSYTKISGDLLTPVSIYLNFRDRYRECILLESSDYHAQKNSFSYICFNPLATFKCEGDQLQISKRNRETQIQTVNSKVIVNHLEEFASSFQTEEQPFSFLSTGLFGYTSYEAIPSFENITFKRIKSETTIPEIYYSVYEFVIAFDHFHDNVILFSHNENKLKADEMLHIISNQIGLSKKPSYPFKLEGEEKSNQTDAEFLKAIEAGKKSCSRGDVFQIVLSRSFSQEFSGDEFNVYRALRRINPSPYLFYFDYGTFKLFGSSPEAQLIVSKGVAEIHPIAGTYKRTGNDEQDILALAELKKDPKENAEHIMLVDLARNDLSKTCKNVSVTVLKEAQIFSHVIHLVSRVVGTLKKSQFPYEVFTGSFPAGTLSGAPKHKAMTIIDKIEPTTRGFYGGAIGFIGFNGNFNHAIMIRTFMSKGNKLHYQAGAGVTIASNNEKELQEINNKVGALRKAIQFTCQKEIKTKRELV